MTEDSIIVGVTSTPTHFVSRRAVRGECSKVDLGLILYIWPPRFNTIPSNSMQNERTNGRMDEQTNEREHDCDQL